MRSSKSFVFRFADVEVREREFTLSKAGEAVQIEPKAFCVLLYLLQNPQKLIRKEELLRSVWGHAVVTENSLTRCIALLRRLLGENANEPRYIETVAKVGYRLVCPVEVVEEGAEPSETDSGPELLGEAVVAVMPPESQRQAEKREIVEVEDVSTGVQGRSTEKRTWRWLVAGGVLMAGLGYTLWYLHRPLHPPRVDDYTQITHDGRPKIPGGTDGSRLYFTRMPSTGISPHSLGQVSVTGGEIAEIPIALPRGEFMVVDISSAESTALIASVEEGEAPFAFWTASLVGGSLRRILKSAQGATFSPDGRSIAYTTQEGELWIMAGDGSGAHKVGTIGSGGAYMPSWSPDGRVIRFDRGYQIWEIGADGSNLHQLLSGWHSAEGHCCGRWTPDGSFYVFASGVLWGERGGQVFALDERRGLLRKPPSDPIQLTLGPTRWGMTVPGKDGKTIFADGTSRHGELTRYDAKSKQFLPFLTGISADAVAFSRDGESVAYVSYPDGILWKANRDGSNAVQLSKPPMYPTDPRWSPDGKQILFSDIDPVKEKSYIVSAEGGSPRQMLPGEDRAVGDPDWSADGRKIVLASYDVSGSAAPARVILQLVDAASGQARDVPGSGGYFSPRWSPDGRKIAALTMDASSSITSGLMVFDCAAQQWTTLVSRHDIEYPSFSADSQFIYYLVLGSDQAVYRVRVKGGSPERVVDLKDWHLTGSNSFWLGLDPTDAPLLLRDDGTSDLYALTLEEK